jgi:hypothetical protein
MRNGLSGEPCDEDSAQNCRQLFTATLLRSQKRACPPVRQADRPSAFRGQRRGRRTLHVRSRQRRRRWSARAQGNRHARRRPSACRRSRSSRKGHPRTRVPRVCGCPKTSTSQSASAAIRSNVRAGLSSNKYSFTLARYQQTLKREWGLGQVCCSARCPRRACCVGRLALSWRTSAPRSIALVGTPLGC